MREGIDGEKRRKRLTAGKHLVEGRKRDGEVGTGVELKGGDKSMKRQADTGRQRLHEVCFN